MNYLIDRAHGMEYLLEWTVQQQQTSIDDAMIVAAPAGMYETSSSTN